MPISAIGRADRLAALRRRRRADRCAGFTLVELMVVLVLIGLMSTAVILSLPDRQQSLRGEAEGLAARARAAQERAILGASATSLRVTSAGYGFDRRVGGRWEAMREREFLDRPWGDGVAVQPGPAGIARVIFDPTGLADPASIILRQGGSQLSVTIAEDGRIDVAT